MKNMVKKVEESFKGSKTILRGYIKCGGLVQSSRGSYPESWDYFEVFGAAKQILGKTVVDGKEINRKGAVVDEELMTLIRTKTDPKYYKGKNGVTRLRIMFLNDELEKNINIFRFCQLAQKGPFNWCMGDEETAIRKLWDGRKGEVPCKPVTEDIPPDKRNDYCEYPLYQFNGKTYKKCMMMANLDVLLPDHPVLGESFRLRTSSTNSAVKGIISNYNTFYKITRGRMTGIEFYLEINMMEKGPKKFPVISLKYGGTAMDLVKAADAAAKISGTVPDYASMEIPADLLEDYEHGGREIAEEFEKDVDEPVNDTPPGPSNTPEQEDLSSIIDSIAAGRPPTEPVVTSGTFNGPEDPFEPDDATAGAKQWGRPRKT